MENIRCRVKFIKNLMYPIERHQKIEILDLSNGLIKNIRHF